MIAFGLYWFTTSRQRNVVKIAKRYTLANNSLQFGQVESFIGPKSASVVGELLQDVDSCIGIIATNTDSKRRDCFTLRAVITPLLPFGLPV